MATLDTAEIRRAAGFVRESGNHMSATVAPGVRNVQADVEDNLHGRAADALNERLMDLNEEARRLVDMMDALSGALMNFAQDLDDADHKLAIMMRE